MTRQGNSGQIAVTISLDFSFPVRVFKVPDGILLMLDGIWARHAKRFFEHMPTDRPQPPV